MDHRYPRVMRMHCPIQNIFLRWRINSCDPYRHDHFYQEASCFTTISGASRSQPVSQYAKQHVESRISFPTIAAHQFLDVFPFISDGGICQLLGGRCDSGRLSHVFLRSILRAANGYPYARFFCRFLLTPRKATDL